MKPSFKARRRARVLAVQALYQVDVAGAAPEQALATALRMTEGEGEARTAGAAAGGAPAPEVDVRYAEELVRYVTDERPRLDALIAAASANWRLDRMARLDAQILRVGAAELARGSAPTPVVIDEAIEIAREYCGDESRAFVNGVLDGVARALAAEREGRAS
ncbi:MAG: transcription antitermination factor NusB [Thermodesulfobacteriota bacterium]